MTISLSLSLTCGLSDSDIEYMLELPDIESLFLLEWKAITCFL